MKCEICGANTTVHITELQTDGTVIARHLCAVHAHEANPPPTKQSLREMVSALRCIATFSRSNKRMPTSDEMLHFGIAGDLSQAPPEDLDRMLKYTEDLADFIEKNGRFPTKQELPNAWLTRRDR